MQLLASLAVLVLWTAALEAVAASNLPANWKTCSQLLPKKELGECLKRNAVMATRDVLLNGVPSLGIGSMNPLRVPQLHVTRGSQSGPISIDILVKDVEIDGFPSFYLLSPPEIDFERHTISIPNLQFSEDIVIQGNYQAKGRVLVMPLDGHGRLNITAKSVTGRWTWDTEPFVKEGQQFIRITRSPFDFNATRCIFNLENLWDGNKALSDTLNAVINDNWQLVLAEMKPAFAEALSKEFTDLANQIVTKVPFDALFPK